MLATLLLAGAAALPPGGGGAVQSLNAYRLTPTVGAPALDGRLDDAVWAAADSIYGFTQKNPDEGKTSRYPTVVRVAFDQQNVYVAMRAYDPDPTKVVAHLTRRDEESPSDWLLVGFDSRHDQRTAYVFAVNPAGVKRDYIAADNANDDTGWDAVWDAAVRRDDKGWTAELRIPLSALRFAPDGDGVWGFEVARLVQRDNEESYWAPIPRDESRAIARFGELRGMRGLPSPRRLELLPYTVTGVTRAPGSSANPFYSATDMRGSAGMDIKYGVTSDLTLDATVNPDFGQVEADPSQVNLSQYETFYPEKRPFFTEGADIFRFGIALGDGDDATEALFYTRRIGRAPHRDVSGDYSYVDAPRESTILGAAKLSGRVGHGWSIGALGAATAREHAQVLLDDGTRSTQVVEPATGYGMLRARRDMNGGRTQIGFVGTAVGRQLGDSGMRDLPSGAFAGGVDFSHRWGNDGWLAQGYLLGSTVRGDSTAILRLQQSPARYFQRPDAGYVSLDSTATSLGGWSGGWTVARVKGKVQGGMVGLVRSPGFEVNDVGYLRQADQAINVGYLQYRRFEPQGAFRNWGVGTNVWQGVDFGGSSIDRGFNLHGSGTLKSYWNLYAGGSHDFSRWSNGALRGGPAIIAPAGSNGYAGFHSDNRRAFNYGGEVSGSREAESGGWSYTLSTNAAWRPTPGVRLSFSPFYSRNHEGWQFVGRPLDAGVNGLRHYVFGQLRQETVGMSVRLNQTFTPALSLQVYAQPFISAGTYGGFMEVVDPRASRFADRLHPVDAQRGTPDDATAWRVGPADAPQFSWSDPDFNYRAVNLNAVLRWEYRSGSTLFVAWSHSREGSTQDGRFRLWHDADALAGYHPTNVLLVKMNWWVSL